MVPPMMGYLIPSISVIFVSIMLYSLNFSKSKLENGNAWRLGSWEAGKRDGMKYF
jgi:hypothetical protein